LPNLLSQEQQELKKKENKMNRHAGM